MELQWAYLTKSFIQVFVLETWLRAHWGWQKAYPLLSVSSQIWVLGVWDSEAFSQWSNPDDCSRGQTLSAEEPSRSFRLFMICCHTVSEKSEWCWVSNAIDVCFADGPPRAIPLRAPVKSPCLTAEGADPRISVWVEKAGGGQTRSNGEAASSNDSSEGRKMNRACYKQFTLLLNLALNAEGNRHRGWAGGQTGQYR